ncbi:hypothetical protein HN385_03310 [archaeon]|nr:hypothetical protein [archaeon]MBT3451428.1 hypothetical protein [archaeon]MBT6869724.1 hypothetical protein [archaeon]MBT7192679.1 hypothetical protein [archaeon]MBT7380704.1 hypothetical protein [archaeon]
MAPDRTLLVEYTNGLKVELFPYGREIFSRGPSFVENRQVPFQGIRVQSPEGVLELDLSQSQSRELSQQDEDLVRTTLTGLYQLGSSIEDRGINAGRMGVMMLKCYHGLSQESPLREFIDDLHVYYDGKLPSDVKIL